MFFLARRAVAASLLTFIARPDPLPAAAPPSCSRSALTTIRETLAQSEKLLPTRDKWPEAQSLLNGVDDAALQKNLDACVESKTFKDVAMDQSAFIVYYEERRYGDTRLEPQTPSLRAEQNGKKKELLRALADEKAEIAYLLKADDDPAELRAYAATARKALDEFLAMLPPS